MTHLRTPRFWLLTTAAVIFGSHVSASAQVGNYQAGAATMVAAAPTMPTISADKIARDVTAETNPRTGQTELVAGSFDPFEEDPNLAGSLRLRSAEGVVAIDGQPLRDGALVDVDFYYNSPSDDPYGGRKYSDASFVNGELAPVVLRDTRILECSTRVDNVVYNHSSYYSPSSRVGIYQPYRHYAGHSGFGFGFGSSYFGPGYSYYDRSRSRQRNGHSYGSLGGYAPRSYRRRNSRISTSDLVGRIVDRETGTETRRDTRRETRRDSRRDGRTETRPSTTEEARQTARTRREMQNRLDRLEAYGIETPGFRGTNNRRVTPMRMGAARERIVAGPAPSGRTNTSTAPSAPVTTQASSNTSDASTGETRSNRRSSSRNQARNQARNQSQNREARRNNRSSNSNGSSGRSETRSEQSRSRSSNTNSSRSRSSSRSSRPSRSQAKSAIKSMLDFFPNDGYGGRQVLTSRSVDCAREDKLSVFVPNARLDAARFDGLTLIALDAQGQETPIYIPPNYIQGYRMAATGRVQPQGYTAVPPMRVQPQFQSQRLAIEAAPCPSGTSKQSDGTCLQNRVAGYPLR